MAVIDPTLSSDPARALFEALSSAHRALDVATLLLSLSATPSRSDLQMALSEAWDAGAAAAEAGSTGRSGSLKRRNNRRPEFTL